MNSRVRADLLGHVCRLRLVLDQVVCGAHGEAALDVGLLAEVAQNEHRDVAKTWVGLDGLKGLQAAHLGMMRSRRIKSTSLERSTLSASTPSEAVKTSYPSCLSLSA